MYDWNSHDLQTSSQDETDAVPVYPTVANSTPIKPGTVIGNHIGLGFQEHNQSSLPFTPSKSRLLGFGVSSRGMSESLLVNGPGQEMMNLSYCSSGKEDGHCGDKRDLDSNTSNFDGSDKDVRVLGGGDMSPPGGYSQGQGQTMVRQNLRGEWACVCFSSLFSAEYIHNFHHLTLILFLHGDTCISRTSEYDYTSTINGWFCYIIAKC